MSPIVSRLTTGALVAHVDTDNGDVAALRVQQDVDLYRRVYDDPCVERR